MILAMATQPSVGTWQEPVGHRIDQVEGVVEAASERVDVFAVERGHECRVEAARDLVRQRVAGMLQVLHSFCLGLGVRIVERHLLEHPGRRHDMTGLLLEQIEEPLLAG
jgi:hypothetical protein